MTSAAVDAGGGAWPEVVGREWSADAYHLGAIRTATHHWLAALGVDRDGQHDVVLAVSEAASNAIEHAYVGCAGGSVEVRCWTEAGDACVEVVDRGTWREPPPGNPGRGFGLPMMRRLVPDLTVRHEPHGTCVLLRHPLRDRAPAPGGSPARHLTPLDG